MGAVVRGEKTDRTIKTFYLGCFENGLWHHKIPAESTSRCAVQGTRGREAERAGATTKTVLAGGPAVCWP